MLWFSVNGPAVGLSLSFKTAQCGDSVDVQEIVAIHCPASGIGKDININLSFMFRGQPSPNDHAFPPPR